MTSLAGDEIARCQRCGREAAGRAEIEHRDGCPVIDDV